MHRASATVASARRAERGVLCFEDTTVSRHLRTTPGPLPARQPPLRGLLGVPHPGLQLAGEVLARLGIHSLGTSIGSPMWAAMRENGAGIANLSHDRMRLQRE